MAELAATTRRLPSRACSLAHPTRLSALVLLFLWVGPVSFEQSGGWQLLAPAGFPEPPSRESRIIPAGRALLLEPGTLLLLQLRDGSKLRGRFLGRTLLDSTLYAQRFAARSSWRPLALDESLHVSLRDGRELSGPFAGYGELSLLLRDLEGRPLRIPFEFVQEIRRSNGQTIDPRALTQAFRKGWLPSAEALGLGEPNVPDPWAAALRIPVEDIRSATVELASGATAQGNVALGALVLVVLLVAVVAIQIHNTRQPSCTGPDLPPNLFSRAGVRLTTRPFDLDRGRYVDDERLAADPGPPPGPYSATGSQTSSATSRSRSGESAPGRARTSPVAAHTTSLSQR